MSLYIKLESRSFDKWNSFFLTEQGYPCYWSMLRERGGGGGSTDLNCFRVLRVVSYSNLEA
jgi:hypothetical protein